MNDIEKSTGNVYEDLGSEDSNEMLVKAQLAATIKELIESKGLTQMQAAETIGLPQPKLSRLLNGHFRGISVSKMMEAIVALGREVQIVIGAENAAFRDVQARIEIIHE
ncbi:helix-turn-helix domain-containing protein [Deltaproteobacteria bacterium OttesenSCG-928-K17]|nr:helix-turn-helix domain-containing protein [Deltaproteobacteria bacterium OttesenSCG-928-K17]